MGQISALAALLCMKAEQDDFVERTLNIESTVYLNGLQHLTDEKKHPWAHVSGGATDRTGLYQPLPAPSSQQPL